MTETSSEKQSPKMTTHYVDLPASDEAIAKFKPGDVVYLSGVVYTAREGIYQRVLAEGQTLPMNNLEVVSNANFHCSPAAAPDAGKGSYNIGGVTATASFRFSNGWPIGWMQQEQNWLLVKAACRGMITKQF